MPSFWRMRTASRELRKPPPSMELAITRAGYSASSSRSGRLTPANITALALSGVLIWRALPGTSKYGETARSYGTLACQPARMAPSAARTCVSSKSPTTAAVAWLAP